MFSENLPPGALVLDDVGKCYRRYARPIDWLKERLTRRPYAIEHWAVRDVTFRMQPGEALGIVGVNGAGKSTLLQMIAGTLTPTTGTLRRNGRVAALLELGAGFNPEFTGRENARLNAAIMGLDGDEIEALLPEIIAFSEIGEAIDHPVKTYSSGMFVRLAFSVATAIEPDILIIDEALSVGDGAFARKSFDRIMALRERGVTLLFCSHMLYQVERLCDRAVWIDQGRPVMIGPASRVVQAYQMELDRRYEDDGKKAACDVPQSASVAGHARIRAVRLTVDGEPPETRVARTHQSTVAIEIEFDSDPGLPAPGVACLVHTADGKNLSSMGSWISGPKPIPRSADGRASCRLELPNVPLLRGTYTISVFLMCERGIHVYDHVEYCASFSVETPTEQLGWVDLPHRWHSTTSDPSA